MESSAASQTSL